MPAKPRKKSSSGAVAKVTNALLILLILTFSLTVILTTTGLVSLVVTMTDSMGSTFPHGALAVFVKQGGYSVGDVILFKVHGCLVAHRVTAETERGFKTKGDASRAVDPWVVPLDAVRGKMLFAIPLLGSLVLLLRTPLVFASLTTAIFAMLTWRRLIP
jgi:signal peptidase I